MKLHERFLDDIHDRELREAKRRATVELFRLVEAGRCRHQAVLRYFDEEMGACEDSCDVSTGRRVDELAADAMMGGPAIRSPVRRAAHVRSTAGPATSEEEELFQRLRGLRKSLADRQGVPAYIVFSDKVLREMASRRPGTPSQLLDVPGVGPAKLERYGRSFLEEIGRSAD